MHGPASPKAVSALTAARIQKWPRWKTDDISVLRKVAAKEISRCSVRSGPFEVGLASNSPYHCVKSTLNRAGFPRGSAVLI
jgi:hypothetical protein